MGPKSKKPAPKPQPRRAAAAAAAAATIEKKTGATPNWPPLFPAADLTLTPLVTDQIYLIRNFFPSALCKKYVSFLASLPLITTPGKPKKDEAVRVNDRFQMEDARFAEMLWSGTGMKELITTRFEEEEEEEEEEGDDDGDEHNNSAAPPSDLAQRARQLWGGEPLGLNPNIRVYRYSAGQFFARHYDESNSLTFTPSLSPSSASIKPQPIPARTTWTLLIYLTTCAGGETVFYPEPTRADRNPAPVVVPPETGLALLHRHGDQCMLHEGKEVTGGEKWVLRSDLVVAR